MMRIRPSPACGLLILLSHLGCARDDLNPLPPGFKPVRGTERHESGWPMEIRSLKDDSIMVFVPGGEFSSGLSDERLHEFASMLVRLKPNQPQTLEEAIAERKRLFAEGIRWIRPEEETPTIEELMKLPLEQLIATYHVVFTEKQGVEIPQTELETWIADGRSIEAMLQISVVRDSFSEKDLVLLDQMREVNDPVIEQAMCLRGQIPPQSKEYVAPFYIDKFEVTNRCYRRFTEAVQDENRLPGVLHRAPRRPYYLWDDTERNHDEQPVTCVSEDDVIAYARWAGKAIPTELQWVRAAVGDGERIFPWGNDFATDDCKSNVGKPIDVDTWERQKVQVPAKVGSFPKDRSPFGCFDMAGNVSELVESNNLRGGNAGTYRIEELCVLWGSTYAEYQCTGFRTVLNLEDEPSSQTTDN